MMGHRGMYVDGWKAVTRHEEGTPFEDDVWELYDLTADPSECHDLAAEQPERLAALVERWWAEADAYGVLPLDDRMIELFGTRFAEHTPHRPDRRYAYRPPMSYLPGQVSAAIGGRSWDLDATGRASGRRGRGAVRPRQRQRRVVALRPGRPPGLRLQRVRRPHRRRVGAAAAAGTVACSGLRFRRTGDGATATVVVDDTPVGAGGDPLRRCASSRASAAAWATTTACR